MYLSVLMNVRDKQHPMPRVTQFRVASAQRTGPLPNIRLPTRVSALAPYSEIELLTCLAT